LNYSTWSPTDRYHIFSALLRDISKEWDWDISIRRSRTPKVITVYVGSVHDLIDSELDFLAKFADRIEPGMGYFRHKFHFAGVKPGRIKPSEEVKKEIKIITTLRRLDRQ
jgi:hypothetical protein